MPCSATLNNMTPLEKPTFPGVFDSAFLEKQTEVPEGFIWPKEVQPEPKPVPELDVPLIDLSGFLEGDERATRAVADLLTRACETHGFFQVINHGVDPRLASRAMELCNDFFSLPIEEKMRVSKPRGSRCGYSAAHGERFNAKLPWKETMSFSYIAGSNVVEDYTRDNLGKDYEEFGRVFEKYGEAMFECCLKLVEVLAISVGLDRMKYREFFQDSDGCIMRFNYYPKCPQPNLTLGTGPHCDPTSVTILQQDHTGGLEILHDGNWYSVSPVPGAFVINIGDTFRALTNGKYKSCLHRALVNKKSGRNSIVFFLCPKEDKVVKPPNELLVETGRKYPDFTWSDMIQFLGSSNYRADPDTLQNFINWFQQSSNQQLVN